tara:strand:+ start:317 stop:541 length:225 start_codon:yes stop_codon:yes gene_type:complete
MPEYINITEDEVLEDFKNKLSIPLTDFISNLKDKMSYKGYPILNNLSENCFNEFIELILYNIKIEKLYKNNLAL